MLNRKYSLILLVAATASLAPGRAYAWPADDAWVAFLQSGSPILDVVGDAEQGDGGVHGSVDLVSDTSTDPDAAAGFWYADDDSLYLRMRVDEDPRNGSTLVRASNWGFLIDIDGGDDFEYMLALSGASPTISVYDNADSDTGVDAVAADFLSADATTQSSDVLRIATADTSVHGAPDYFIDLAFSRADLVVFTGADLDGDLQFVIATNDDPTDNQVDNDCAGHDDTAGLGTLAECLTDVVGIDRDADGLSDPEESVYGTDPLDADSDEDGLNDQQEQDAGTDPNNWDSDGDTLSDGLELGVTAPTRDTDTSLGLYTADADPASTTNPLSSDTDGGTLADGDEDLNGNGQVDPWETDPNYRLDDVDSDGDGIPDSVEAECDGTGSDSDRDGDGKPDASEGVVDTDGDGIADFCDEDDDADGLPSVDETTDDTDEDGLPNDHDPDSDGDGIDDGTEGTGDDDGDGTPNNLDPDDSDGPNADPDADGLTNAEEDACGSDRLNADSDGDTIPDADEACVDTDCDGLPDRIDANNVDGTCDSGGDDTATDDGCEDVDGDGVLDCGYYAGGSCSTAPGAAGSMLTLIGGLALVFRRKRRRENSSGAQMGATLVGLTMLASGQAHAQDGLDAQRFRPSLDSRTTLGVEDSQVAPTGFGGGAYLNYAQDPLVYRSLDGSGSDLQLVGPLFTTDLQALYTWKPLRVGVNIPLTAYGTDVGTGGATLGDIRFDAKFMAMDRLKTGYGLGLDARLSVPTGDARHWLGDGTPTTQITAIGSVGKTLMGTANFGFRSGPATTLSNLNWGNRLTWGVGGSAPVLDDLSVFAELDGEVLLVQDTLLSGASTRLPGEWRVGARYQLRPRLQATIAGGGGYTPGIGSPDFRIVLGISTLPALKGSARDEADTDADGIPDSKDLCPNQAEDMNGKNDSDGCPDAGLTPTTITVIDTQGRKITGAAVDLTDGPENGRYILQSGYFTRSIPPGPYSVHAGAEGYGDVRDRMVVPDAERYEKTITLGADLGFMPLTVIARNEAGKPVDALVTVFGAGKKFQTGPDGIGEGSLKPGPTEISVWAEGYQPERVKTVVEPNARVEVTLRKSRVEVRDNEVIILDKVFFELDSSILKAESIRILDDVAATLIAHPEIELIEVQGHTDDQGSDEYNIGLSQRRAETVKSYLSNQGVEGKRLIPKGFGETTPLQPGASEEAREANRRVAFKIVRGPRVK